MSSWIVDGNNIYVIENAFHKLTGRSEVASNMIILAWFFHLPVNEQSQIMYGEWCENLPGKE